ncbi:MAG: peptide chain release factor 2 [Patescibacteria group bacterium]|nr:peptide chain release factor 2 [Patescibacteria group bacterium]
MLKQQIEALDELNRRVTDAWRLLDLDKTKADIDATEWETQQPDFWKDTERAQQASRRLGELKEYHATWEKMVADVRDLTEYAKLAASEGEDASVEAEVGAKLAELQAAFSKLEFATLMSDKYDDRDAIVAIHAGAGGTDAQDWAEMLLRMYLRYAERKGWRVKMLDESRGQEAGIKSAVFAVEGRYAYGHLKCEAGVHRLVRLSPFNADQLRQTSFALLEVLPELGDLEEVKIDPKDIRIDTFLSSGHGGQSVQTTYSAVRITHIPTGIVVSCQNERSQTQNKETAMRILRAKLHAIYLKEREAEKKQLRGEFTSAEWGSQIRSYVIHPYKMVKDHRTKHETADTDRVLDGDLDDFIEAYLRHVKQK